MKNLVSASLASRILTVANGGNELSAIPNFEMKIVRDGEAMVIRHETKKPENEGDEPEQVPVTTYLQTNLHFKKLKNFTQQINSITEGYKDCYIQAGDYKVPFKGGRFAINAEKLLQEITENYLRFETGQLVVDNESSDFEYLQEKFTQSFVGQQTSILNYLALIDTFKNAKPSELQAMVSHISIDENAKVVFSQNIMDAVKTHRENEERRKIEAAETAE